MLLTVLSIDDSIDEKQHEGVVDEFPFQKGHNGNILVAKEIMLEDKALLLKEMRLTTKVPVREEGGGWLKGNNMRKGN